MKSSISKFAIILLVALISLLIGLFINTNIFSSIENKTSGIYTKFKRNKSKKILWNNDFELVKIKSSLDQNIQNAYFYKTKTLKEAPLIVSLHSWRGDYAQFDSLAVLCKLRDVNYIHPNFRGPNLTPEACCSKLALNDIDEAISYAIANSNVDTTRIFVIGASGGGYATLGTFMKSKYNISNFSAWAPISDLTAWYKENLSKGEKYSEDILNCTNSKNGKINIENAKNRSPLYWNTPKAKLKKSKLYIYAGVYDGIKGSVPYTHSINFYNKILSDLEVTDSTKYVTEKEKQLLSNSRSFNAINDKVSNREIVLKKESHNVKLVIYRGDHEFFAEYAFNELIEH